MKILFWWPHSERDSNWAPISRVVGQAVIRLRRTAHARVWSQAGLFGTVVEEVGLGQVSLRVLRFPMSVSFHHWCILIRLQRYAILRIESVVKLHTLTNRAPVEYVYKLLPLLQPVRQNLRKWQPLTSTSRYLLSPAVLGWSFPVITGKMDALMNWCNEPGALFPYA